MDDVVLTFYCAAAEADMIAENLSTASALPVHVRAEAVHGHDFGDAKISEQVLGQLARAAVTLEAPRATAEALVRTVAALRRGMPVRWVMVPVVARGRFT